MHKNSYEIDIHDLYRTWKVKYKNLYEFFDMETNKKTNLIPENPNVEPVNEIFMKDLVKNADHARKLRSRSNNIVVSYKGVAKTKGWITFNTTSQYTRGKYYFQYVKLLDIKDIKSVKGFAKRDIVRLLLSGNVACYCSCPDFLYAGWKYMGYTKGYGIFKETRFPRIRNPRLEGTVCKHLLAVFSVFMTNWLSISRDMQNSYYWKNRYGKDNVDTK